MEELTPIQKYCDRRGLCWTCQEEYNNCNCKRKLESDYQELLDRAIEVDNKLINEL